MAKQGPKRGRSGGAVEGLSAGHREYLGRSRRRRHAEAADAGGGGHDPARVPSHPLICPAAAEMIADQPALDALIERLRAVGRFAFDTEFIGEQSYYPRLCLIQVATESFVALIDAEAELDLGGFWTLVADPAVEKIVHAGEQDLEPARRLTGRPAAGVFDTQIAAGFAALPYPLNLRELVLRLTGARLHKASGFTQWDARPLTPAQVRYAADDVRYLPAVRAVLEEMLLACGTADWARQEMAASCAAASRDFDAATQVRRMRGARDLSGRQLAVLAELLAWREQYAAACDAPARALAGDDALRLLARRHGAMTDAAALGAAGQLSARVVAAQAENILEALRRGATAPTAELKANLPSQESAQTRQALDYLWVLVQAASFAAGVHPALVASRKDLADAVDSNGHDDDDNALNLQALLDNPLNTGWRGELLGDLLARAAQTDVRTLKIQIL